MDYSDVCGKRKAGTIQRYLAVLAQIDFSPNLKLDHDQNNSFCHPRYEKI